MRSSVPAPFKRLLLPEGSEPHVGSCRLLRLCAQPRRGSPPFRRRRTRREFSPLRPPQSSPAWFTHAFAVLIYEFCLIDWVSSSWFTLSLLLFALQQFAFLSPQVVNIGNPHKNLACIISVECIKSFWCGLLFDLWKIRWIRLWQ